MAQTIRSQQTNLILGNRKTLFMRGSNFGTGLTYTSTIADIQGLQNAHRTHVSSNSNGKAYIQDYVITPVFNIPSVPIPAGAGGIKHLLDSAAVANGYVLADYNYLAYSSRVPFGAGGLGSGNGLNGNLWISDNLTYYHPGLVHEFYHAFGLGHAEYIEAGAYIFPGVNTYGGLDPYHHIGSDYSGSAAPWLSQDLAPYHKYYLGWLEATNITVINKPTTAAGSTHRIYRHNNLTALTATRKVSLQIGDKFWVSYEPTTTSPDIRKTGVLVHYLPLESPAVTRLLDGTPDSRPGTTKAQQYDDLFDAALAVGETMVFDDISLDVVSIGGTGEDAWVDVRASSCIAAPGNDADGDGVCNAEDRCIGNNNLDADFDGKPDACDTCPNDPNNDANANGICDDIECFPSAAESFEYASFTDLTTAASGTGLTGNWAMGQPYNGVLEINNGSLVYPGLATKGNSLRLAPTTNSVVLRRNMTNKTGNEFWISFLVKVNNRNNGTLYMQPNGNLPLAIGKKWVTEFSINRTGTGIMAQNGQTYLLVARYKIGATIDVAHFWVNPDLKNFPSLAAANATQTAATTGALYQLAITVDWYDGAGDYIIDEVRVSCSPPPYNASYVLPIELLNFTAAPLTTAAGQSPKTVQLKWQTASEKNASHFEIERSFDGKSFHTIGQIKAQGNSSTLQNYALLDEKPAVINYYRLRQIDMDGTATLSNTLSVAMDKRQQLDVYPSPAKDKIVIVSPSTSNFSIYDILGHQILRGSLSENSTDVDVSALPTGMYWVRVQDAVTKFVKQ